MFDAHLKRFFPASRVVFFLFDMVGRMPQEAVRNHPSRHVDDGGPWHDLRIDLFAPDRDEIILSRDQRTP
jgi:hypothetical protein